MRTAIYDGMAEAIKAIRQEKGLTRLHVARRGGIASKTFHDWEAGTRRTQRVMLPKLLQGLECTEIELWEKKIEVEAAHYRGVGEDAFLLAVPSPAAFVARFERIQNLDLDGLTPEQHKLMRLFQQVAAEVFPLLEQITKMIQHLREDDR